MRVGRYTFLAVLLMVTLFFPCVGVAALQPGGSPLLLSEVQTGSSASAFDEYIELAVVGSEHVSVTDWRLMYTSATTTAPALGCQLAVFVGSFTPGAYILVASAEYVAAPDIVVAATYTHTPCTSNSVLSPSKGIVSLIDELGVVRDQFSYGSIVGSADTQAVSVTSTSRIFERLANPDTGELIDTDSSAQDFLTVSMGTPGVLPQPAAPVDTPTEPEPTPVEEVVIPEPEPVDTGEMPSTPLPEPPVAIDEQQSPTPEQPTVPPQPTSYPTILLNELYIDPASPLTDSNDEWVELYNPNDTAVELAGYVVATGSKYAYSYTFGADARLEPKAFLILSSGDTPLALANSEGAARVSSPVGAILDQVTYETAKTGQSWARGPDGLWLWTTMPTPAAENQIILMPAVVATAAKKAATTTVKKKATTSTSSAKSTTTKAAKPKTTTVKAAKATGFETEPKIAAPTPVPGWLLALVAALAILYGAYEYRYDLANKLWQLRRHREARGATRR